MFFLKKGNYQLDAPNKKEDEKIKHTRNIVSLMDRNPALYDSIILHITHRHHIIDLLDAQPVQDVRHQCLEAHVLDTGDHFSGFEVFIGGVASAFTQVVYEISISSNR